MRKIFAGAVIAASLSGTPALAQSYWSTMGTGNVVTFYPVANGYGQIGSTGEFAYGPTVPLARMARAHHARHRRAW
jgi:hypothetical protein